MGLEKGRPAASGLPEMPRAYLGKKTLLVSILPGCTFYRFIRQLKDVFYGKFRRGTPAGKLTRNAGPRHVKRYRGRMNFIRGRTGFSRAKRGKYSMQKEEIRLSGFALPWRADAAFPSFLFFGSLVRLSYGKGHDETSCLFMCGFLRLLFLSGCDRAPSSGEKRAAPSAEREKPSAVRKEAEIWRERLTLLWPAPAARRKNGSEHVKALNDVAALYAEGLQNGWVHPLDVRAWCDSVAETGSGYSGKRSLAPCSCMGRESSVMP